MIAGLVKQIKDNEGSAQAFTAVIAGPRQLLKFARLAQQTVEASAQAFTALTPELRRLCQLSKIARLAQQTVLPVIFTSTRTLSFVKSSFAILGIKYTITIVMVTIN
jgi:hypothetical protein